MLRMPLIRLWWKPIGTLGSILLSMSKKGMKEPLEEETEEAESEQENVEEEKKDKPADNDKQ